MSFFKGYPQLKIGHEFQNHLENIPGKSQPYDYDNFKTIDLSHILKNESHH